MAQVIARERLIMYACFEEICAKHIGWDIMAQIDRETLIRRMERSCFKATVTSCTLDGVDRLFTDKRFVQRYCANCSRVMANLDPTSSVGSLYLLDHILRGDIDPYNVADLVSKDLCPDASKAEREEIALRMTVKTPMKVSRAYKCRKCGGQETVFIEFQARSADEASTKSIKCVGCEYVWRS